MIGEKWNGKEKRDQKLEQGSENIGVRCEKKMQGMGEIVERSWNGRRRKGREGEEVKKEGNQR